MTTKNKNIVAKTAPNALKTLLVCLLIIITVVIVSINVFAQSTNEPVDQTNETVDDTWFDTHWGGDTGEEVYNDPPPEVPEEEEPSSSACTLGIMTVGMCIPAVVISYQKKGRQPKDE